MEKKETELHPIFQRDPAELMQYIYKEVHIVCTGNLQYTGWVYTVDPVTGDVILKHLDKEDIGITHVMGHCIESMVITNDNAELHKTELDMLFKSVKSRAMLPEDIVDRFKKMKLWLERNRIPVKVTGKDDDILCVADALYIEPPYSVDNCRSTNEIILGKVQGLVQSLPSDIEEW